MNHENQEPNLCPFCGRDWTKPFNYIVERRSRFQRVKYCPRCRMELSDKEAKVLEQFHSRTPVDELEQLP